MAESFKNRDYSVEFATSCYEKDWELLLKTDRLRNMVSVCNYKFDKVTLYLNNISQLDKAKAYAQKYVEEGIIDEYVVIDDHAEEVLSFFEIKEPLRYYYLIQCLTMIYRSSCDYLLHFTCDASLVNKEAWIDAAILRMQQNHKIMVANAMSTEDINRIEEWAIKEDDEFYYSHGFSDQCCLMKTSLYRSPIYNEPVNAASHFPEKHRGAFEERAFQYMRNHGYYRITHKKAVYRHKNFPKDNLKKWLALNLGINNKKYGLKQ